MQPRESLADATPDDLFESDETTVALGNAPAAQPRPASPVLVLSEDPMLLEAISAAVLDLAATIVSPSADRFVDQLFAGDVELVLIDTAAAPQDLPEFLNSLRRQFPHLQMLLAGPGTVQHLIATQMTDGTVFRFAHKPASAQRLRLFVDAALRERQARITQQIVSTSFPGVTAGANSGSQRRRPGWMTISVALVLTLVAAGLAVWFVTRPQQQRPAAVAAPPEVVPEVAAAPHTSALDDAAAQAAAEQEAIDRAAAERSERSEKERLAAEMEARQATLADQIRRSAKEDAQLALGVDKDSGNAAPPAAAPAPAPAAATIEAAPPIAQAAPSEAPPSPVAVTPQQSDSPIDAPARTRAATVASAQTLPESALHRVTFVAPDYPQDALLNRQTGTVELEFTVTPEGTVTDIEVITSDPRGLFDHASIMALSRDRYEPVMRDAVPVAQRARIRLRFTP